MAWHFKNVAHCNVCAKLNNKKIVSTKYMDIKLLEQLKLKEEVDRFFDNIRWMRFAQLRYLTYRDTTLKF